MQKRTLGKTGLSLSVLGAGGFHLLEAASEDVTRLLNTYLDRGGNYIETAAGYGDGVSEAKIARAVGKRRREYHLATKCHARTRAEAEGMIDKSLRFLATDHVDVLFMHAVQTDKDVDQILSDEGAIRAAEKARDAGKVRFLACSGHGRQDVMRRAIERYPFDVIMTGFNYLDRFSFPTTEDRLLPDALAAGIGVLAMKPFADGYLHRSWRQALRYTLGLPVACVVAGMNTMEHLSRDLEVVEHFTPMSASETESLFRTAPELKDYVCRRCGKCVRDGFDPQEYFLLEGLYDRQMDDRRLADTADYALRERLRFWFGQREEARAEYAALPRKIDPKQDYRPLSALCPYGIDVDRKLKIAHEKLGQDGFIY